MDALLIPRMIVNALGAHARGEFPHECVGLLVGALDGQVRDAYPLINELKSPTRFLSEPRSMLAAEKKRRAAGLEVLAVYHSHPTSPPIPSKFDISDHLASEILCVIISLQQPEPEIRAWRIADGMFSPVTLQIITNSQPPPPA